ncbi:inactive cadmium/zinc-transporting ATPase HMA3 isoform X2 [Canna indica]|uniref:Inactive cadmium/zinc-transporting ATPase HMA3 isoform X2 n=1 Tax=Canna indica TaxID=4628 RepID=A0AAQ3KAJ9_9LILI|nr:inactive cadmium/zinc-transporting ATPase HMA3 isoform X2 [Canna indica]
MAPIGTFALSDTCRMGAAEAIKELKSLSIKTAMLTGDTSEAARHAQTQLDEAIEEVHTELLPEDKRWNEKRTCIGHGGCGDLNGSIRLCNGDQLHNPHVERSISNDSQSHQFGEEDKKQDHHQHHLLSDN